MRARGGGGATLLLPALTLSAATLTLSALPALTLPAEVVVSRGRGRGRRSITSVPAQMVLLVAARWDVQVLRE